MQLVKIKYPTEIIISLHLLNFEKIKYLEVIEIFQYDRLNFVTLNRIFIKDRKDNPEKIIETTFHPELYQIIEIEGDEIMFLMKHRNDKGFWPSLMSDSWTILPPIIIDEKYIKETLLIKTNFEEVYKEYSKIIKNLEVVAINEIHHISEEHVLQKKQLVPNWQPFPLFTARQQEIATYATRHGYYKSPKEISADSLAEKFNISISAVNEHLRKAEQVAMRYFFS